MNFYLTFDIDLTDYLSGRKADEMSVVFPSLQSLFIKYRDIKTSWFIRLDSQIAALYGEPDFIFREHGEKIAWLRGNGHRIGWHYHAYQYTGNKWEQCVDDDLICDELEKYSGYAKKYELHITRMGWGYQSNRTLQKIYDLGFRIDSSAIVRPVYPWEKVQRDWTGTPNGAYYPSKKDYRVAGDTRIGILEIPITTTVIRAVTDSQEIRRYINMAYRNSVFTQAIESLGGCDNIVSITHPYELSGNLGKHPLLSFDMVDFEENIQYLLQKGYKFENDFNKLTNDADS